MKITKWHGCYDLQWSGFITKGSFVHPAKYSRGLIERIFDHMLQKGWVEPGDVIGDCFGGVATGGLIAAYRGFAWIGVELEPKFVTLGLENIDRHWQKLAQLKRPIPQLLQGDSRNFDLIVKAAAVVTSPPYSESLKGHKDGIDWEKSKSKPTNGIHQAPGASCHSIVGSTPGQIAALNEGSVAAVVSSPPYAATSGKGGGGINVKGYVPAEGRKWTGEKTDPVGDRSYQGQGSDRSDGNIEILPEGSVDAVVSSPPYAGIAAGAGGLNTKPAKHPGQQSGRSVDLDSQNADQRYGASEGQISKLTEGDVSAVVTSPPFEDRVQCQDPKYQASGNGHGPRHSDYGTSKGQIGKESSETYWQAMNLVYSSTFRAIKPGGYIAVVVKDYVSKKQRVPLCDDTVRLLEHCGFEMVERVHAMLTSETVHDDMFEGTTKSTRSRKSFFRRLAEKKGSPPIDFEEVLFARRPIL